VYAASGITLLRAPFGATTLSFSTVGSLPAAPRALAWSDHFGAAGQDGLYALDAAAGYRIHRVSPAQARGQQPLAPTLYYATLQPLGGLAACADGSVLLAAPASVTLRDNADVRLGFEAWARDEFAQVVRLARSLITTGPGAGGGPEGFVIDADVIPGWTRFHPASPDAAAWTILALLANDEINGDPTALPTIRTILRRHAGLAADGISPRRNADGIFIHWIDPATGAIKSGWNDGYATMSTMKIVLAADRARRYYPGDVGVREAADAIICSITNWDSYFTSDARMYLKARSTTGPDTTSLSSGWHEGVIFAQQAGLFGTANGPAASARWLSRAGWPLAIYLVGRPVTGYGAGAFTPGFIAGYPLLLIDSFRASPAWRTHIADFRASHNAWTDDNGPKYLTFFSAGTTRGDWGGYHADTLTDRPGNVTTFTSLLALAAGDARIAETYGAYQAYRRGARQTFLSGASILYRRSDIDRAYEPNSAGLPDVVLGALGLADLISPGVIDRVLAPAYGVCGGCPADFNADGFVDFFDFDDFVTCFGGGSCPAGQDADFNEDGFTDFFDFDDFVAAFDAGC
jgi:hypothetical protein